MSQANQRRAVFAANSELLAGIRRGVEKEGLRTDMLGNLARTPHPPALGAALANPFITTDYSEALLELITSPHASVAAMLASLEDIHAFVVQRNPAELVWCQSMPARLPAEADIPVAWYGSSNSGMLKHVYRQGLAWRYGKLMQCIAGVHYNFSLPQAVWQVLPGCGSERERRDSGYMALIRNFMRHAWLLMYLFGASPAVSGSFIQGAVRADALSPIGADSYYLPWATSLRMSDLGYKSPVQSELQLCYNDLDTFTARIHNAATTVWPPYEAIGTHRGGQRIQLNPYLLQIENEYYSSIRPKQTTARCERPNTSLRERGIQYIEVRCLDIDPWEPAGISAASSHFLDAFLLFCALEDSPMFPPPGYCQESQANFALVAREGRRPGLLLNHEGCAIGLADWAREIIERIQPYAELLDGASGANHHAASLRQQLEKIEDPEKTPSARVLQGMLGGQVEFHDWALELSRQHYAHLQARQLSAAATRELQAAAAQSLQTQKDLEADKTESFEEYVARYHQALH